MTAISFILNSIQPNNMKQSSFLWMLLFPFMVMLSVVIIIPITFTLKNQESLWHAIPYMLIFTGMRDLAKSAWRVFGTPIDLSIDKDFEHIPELQASEYSIDKLREITEDFSVPAVVRGLFKDTPAIENWVKPGYLKSVLGRFEIPVIRNAKYGNPQNNKTNELFGAAIDDIFGEDSQKSYLFFPMKNRPTKNHYGSNNKEFELLTSAVNQLMLDDLKIDQKIWPRFGTSYHTEYLGSQFVIGKGTNDTETTTGSGID